MFGIYLRFVFWGLGFTMRGDGEFGGETAPPEATGELLRYMNVESFHRPAGADFDRILKS
jgi:hypothetical protein